MRICRKCCAAIEEDMLFCPECGTKYVVRDTQVYTAENCPIAVVEQNLITSEEGTNIVILFANIANEAVNAVSVRLKCYDQMEDELADTIVKYSDLSAESGESFGENKVIVPADADTRSFKIIVEKILLEESGLTKNVFSEFIRNNDLNYLRKQVDNHSKELNNELKMTNNRQLIEQSERLLQEHRRIGHEWKKAYQDAQFSYQITKQLGEKNRQILRQLYTGVATLIISKNESRDALSFAFDGEFPKKIILLEGVTKIDRDAFGFCKSLESVELPSTVTEIGKSAFSFCESLKSIDMSATSVRKIEEFTFSQCKSLKSIKLPNTVKEIGKGAFAGCKSLESINIPNTVTKIEERAFESCIALKEIYLPASVINIAAYAFKIDPKADPKWVAENNIQNCPAKIIRDADIRFEQYWTAHAEEKQQLEEELKQLKSLSVSDNPKISELNGHILDLKKQRDYFISVPSEQEKEKISNKISTLRTRMNSLGIFKGKEKKAVQAQIDELQSKLPALDDVIEQEKEARKKEINAEIAKIEEELKPFNDKKLQLQKRIDEINQELTKPR